MATVKKKLFQATLFGTRIKSAKTIYQNPKNPYEQFVNLYVNIHQDLNRERAVKNAQEEWKALTKSPSLIQAMITSMETVVL